MANDNQNKNSVTNSNNPKSPNLSQQEIKDIVKDIINNPYEITSKIDKNNENLPNYGFLTSGAEDGKKEEEYAFFETKIGTNDISITPEQLTDLNLNPHQINYANSILSKSNNLFSKGYFTEPVKFDLYFFNSQRVTQKSSEVVLAEYKDKLQNLALNENDFIKEQQELKQQIEHTVNLEMSKKLMSDLKDVNKKLIQTNLLKSGLEFQEQLADTSINPSGLSNQISIDKNLIAYHASPPSLFVSDRNSCAVTMTSMGKGEETPFSIFQENAVTNQLNTEMAKEFVLYHEMSHCDFQGKQFKQFNTGDTKIDSKLDYLFSAKTNLAFTTNAIRNLHEQYADSSAIAILFKEKGVQDKDLKQFIEKYSNFSASTYSTIHQTVFASQMLLQPEVLKNIDKTPIQDISKLALSISERSFLYGIVNSPKLQEFVMEDFPKSAFTNSQNSRILNMATHDLLLDTPFDPALSQSESTAKDLHKIVTKHVKDILSTNPALKEALIPSVININPSNVQRNSLVKEIDPQSLDKLQALVSEHPGFIKDYDTYRNNTLNTYKELISDLSSKYKTEKLPSVFIAPETNLINDNQIKPESSGHPSILSKNVLSNIKNVEGQTSQNNLSSKNPLEQYHNLLDSVHSNLGISFSKEDVLNRIKKLNAQELQPTIDSFNKPPKL